MQKPLLLLSGGVDSTLLLARHALAGESVNMLYIDLKNNAQKSKRELEAIHNSIMWLGADPYNLRITKQKQRGTSYGWFFPAMLAYTTLMSTNLDDVEYFELGYVMGDDAASRQHDIKVMWEALSTVIHPKTKPKEVRFPFLDDFMGKELIYEEYQKLDLMPLFNMTTSCEYPEHKKGCQCKPCQTRRKYDPNYE